MSLRILLVVLALTTGAVAGSSVALAQPDPHAGHDHGAPPPGGGRGAIDRRVVPDRGGIRPAAPPGTPGKTTAREDIAQGSGKGMALLFWLFALGCVAGSVFVITRRNLIAAVMGMVATFFGVAAIYMMLYAHFLSVVQMLVYAGAIMVLFVFVIMVLNQPEDDPWVEKRALFGKVVALVAMAYLVLRMAGVLWAVASSTTAQEAALAPRSVVFQVAGERPEIYDWGSTAAVGKELFTAGLFPFEAISILLLIAVVGAIAIARPLKNDETPGAAGSHR